MHKTMSIATATTSTKAAAVVVNMTLHGVEAVTSITSMDSWGEYIARTPKGQCSNLRSNLHPSHVSMTLRIHTFGFSDTYNLKYKNQVLISHSALISMMFQKDA